MTERYLTAKEVADLLQVDERTVKRYADKGELPGYKVMGKWRFDPQEVERYIRSKQQDDRRG